MIDIDYDTSATFTFTSGSTTTPYTMGTGLGGILIITTSFSVTAIDYGGQSMSQDIHFEPSIHDGNQQQENVYILQNPPTGSNTITLTAGGNGTIGIISYTGVDSIETYNTYFSNNGTNNTQVLSLQGSVTSTADNCWSVMFCRGGNNFPNTFSGARATAVFIFGDGAVGIYDSNGPISPAGNSTLTATWSAGTGFISNVILSMKPIVDSTDNFFLLL